MTIEANNQLFEAITKVDLNGVVKALSEGADVNAMRKDDKFTPLHAVIWKATGANPDALQANLDILKLLLAQPRCNLGLKDAKWRTPKELANKFLVLKER